MEDRALLVKMVLDMWNARVKQIDSLLRGLSDEQLCKKVAPTKNRGIYLLGHLTATHDQLFRLLDICKPIFPDYQTFFLDNPDKGISKIPSVSDVRKSWANVNIQLSKHFKLMHTNEWFLRHTSVSQDDFEKEPHRNKLNIMLTRSNHLGYHFGQLVLLKK